MENNQNNMNGQGNNQGNNFDNMIGQNQSNYGYNSNQNNYGNQQNYGDSIVNNLPPNVGNMGMPQSGFSLKNIMGMIDKFTRDIDKIVVGIGDSIENAINGNNISNGINNINQALDQAQRFDNNTFQGNMVKQDMNTEQSMEDVGISQGKIMDPVIGRSTISLSNGNEVGKLPEMGESILSEYGYLANTNEAPVNNIGQMATPEIHSILDKQEQVMPTNEVKSVSLNKSENESGIIVNEVEVQSDENKEKLVVNESTVKTLEDTEVKSNPVSLTKNTDNNENNDSPVDEIKIICK